MTFWKWNTPRAHETPLREYVNEGPVLPQHVRDANGMNGCPHLDTITDTFLYTELLELAPGYRIHATAEWEAVTVDGTWEVVGVHRRDYDLFVHEAHRGKNIGLAMVVWRTENRGQRPRDKQIHRTPRARRLTIRAHRVLVERALGRGEHVPDEVMADYPDLEDPGPRFAKKWGRC